MTVDWDAKHQCPHQVRGEWVGLQPDRQTLIPRRNPSSTSSIEVSVNGSRIPSHGRYGNITITASKQGPFDLSGMTSPSIAWTLNGTSMSAQLPKGERITARQVQSALERQIEPPSLEVSLDRRRLRFRYASTEPHQTFQFQSGSAHEALGLPAKRFYRNRQLAPGWDVVRPSGPVDPNERWIVFEEPVDTRQNIFEISYPTRRRECRRCRGRGTEYDLRYTSSGEPQWISGIGLMVQEVEKMLFTLQGSNPFHPWYGTTLSDIIGTKMPGGGIIESQLFNEVRHTIDQYQSVKRNLAGKQPVPNDEMIRGADRINVQQHPNDPTAFSMTIHLINQQQHRQSLQRTIVRHRQAAQSTKETSS